MLVAEDADVQTDTSFSQVFCRLVQMSAWLQLLSVIVVVFLLSGWLWSAAALPKDPAALKD